MISNNATQSLVGAMETAFLAGSHEKGKDGAVAGRKRSCSNVSDVEADDDSNPKKRHVSMDDKKMKRVMANRRSARESRERRKNLLSNLEASVEALSRDNANLTRENNELRKQLARLMPQPTLSMFNPQQMPSQGLSALYANQLRPSAQQTAQLLQIQKEQQLLEAMRRRQGF